MSRPEEALHRAAATYLDLALPEDAVHFHIPNGGGRSRAEAGIFKAMGVKAGIPDHCIIYRNRPIFIEFKAGKGRLTEAQKAMQLRLTVAGAVVLHECRCVEELMEFLLVFMPLRARVA